MAVQKGIVGPTVGVCSGYDRDWCIGWKSLKGLGLGTGNGGGGGEWATGTTWYDTTDSNRW
jgi:hypothetical protein